MTADHATRSEAVLAGLDVSRPRHEVLIEAPGRIRRRRSTIPNRRADFDRLIEMLRAPDGRVRIAFEGEACGTAITTGRSPAP